MVANTYSRAFDKSEMERSTELDFVCQYDKKTCLVSDKMCNCVLYINIGFQVVVLAQKRRCGTGDCALKGRASQTESLGGALKLLLCTASWKEPDTE